MTTPTGANSAQERNARAVDQLEDQAATSVRAAIAAMLADVLASMGEVDLDEPPPTVEAVAAVARTAWARLRDQVLAWVRDTFRRLVTRAVANLPDDSAPDLPERTVEQRVLSLMDQISAKLDGVPDVVASRVATQLREGYARGESPQALRRRVADVLARDEWDAEVVRIARTTTTSVYNAAHTAAADALEAELRRPLRRMWLATRDTRTRPTHREASGQVIEPGDTFRVGDSRLRFPGDPLGPPEEVILCRCVVLPVVDDVVIDLAHRVSGREAAVLDTDTNDTLAAAVTAATRMPPQFVTYWTVGEGGGEIRWDTHGDMTRCMRALRRYLGPDELGGACANLHHLMTGRWPAEDAAAEEGEADMPCPCENATEEEIRTAAALAATVTGDPDLPIADRDREWDGDAAADRVRAWATPDGAELVDADRYARAFFYRDPAGEPETETAYKLGFADVVDGELTAIPAGIFAVAAVLEGGRGGVDIPEEDADGVRDRVAGYYRRMAEQFDDPELMVPWDSGTDGAPDRDEDMNAAEPVTAATLEEARTMAMIALIPSEQDAATLAVEGEAAIPPAELHVTLAFLGPGADWEGENADRVHQLAERIAADVGPITARVWATAITGADSETGATPFFLVGDDTGRLAELQGGVLLAGGDLIPPQHSPFVAHVSVRYGNADMTGMDAAVGSEITLDRVRVAIGEAVTDYPLTGDDSVDLDDEDEPATPEAEPDEEPTTASADEPDDREAGQDNEEPRPARTAGAVTADLRAASDTMAILAQAVENAPQEPPGAWFAPIVVDKPTPPTVNAQGRVWGHIGQAGVCHRGITDECVEIPPTRTNYGAFHRESIVTAEGDAVEVGYLYTGCDHSNLNMDLDEARGYLDSSCTRTAAGRVYDTEFGPLFVGAVLPGVTAEAVARLHKLSGEWFTAPLELHAAVGVDDAGYPVDGTDPNGILVSEDDPQPVTAAAPATDTQPAPVEPAVVDVAAAVAAIDTYRKRAALRTAEPAVRAARRNRAARAVAGYTRRGA